MTVIKEKIESYTVSEYFTNRRYWSICKVADEKDVKNEYLLLVVKQVNVICHWFGNNECFSRMQDLFTEVVRVFQIIIILILDLCRSLIPQQERKITLGPIENTIEEEGGYQADPTDLGNYTKENRQGKLLGTNMGITPREWAKYKRVGVDTLTADDMKNITHDEAVGFYQDRFERFGVDNYPVEVQYQIFDMTTLHGGWRKIVRDAEARPGGVTNNNLVEARLDYFDALINRKPELVKYKNGWYARAERFYA